MNIKKQAFTLVELIVVITILAILWTIAFISLQWYSESSRDSVRISDVSNMKTSLALFELNSWKYPLPDDNQVVSYSWDTLWYQWIFWSTALSSLSKTLNKIPKDPLTYKEYTYSVTQNKSEYQILSLLESDLSLNSINKTNAALVNVITKLDWTYNWIFVKSSNYIVPTPSIVNSEVNTWTLILDSTNIKSQIVNNWKNRLKFWTNSWKSWWLNIALSVYNWTIDSLKIDSNLQSLAEKIKLAYTWSEISTELVYKELVDLNTNNLDDLKNTVWNLVNNSLWAKVNISDTTPDPCINPQTPTDASYFNFDESTNTLKKSSNTFLTDIVIPCSINWVNVLSIWAGAFRSTNLTSVVLPDTLTSILWWAFNTNSLTSIVIPSNVTSIWDNAFAFNTITSVTNYDWIVSSDYIYSKSWAWIEIDYYIWVSNTPIIPSTINWKNVVSIWNSSFKSNWLTSVTIPNWVTNIWSSAFSSNSLSTLVIPTSITSIWDNAFGSNSITSITNYDWIVSSEYLYSPSWSWIEIDYYIWSATILNIPSTINSKNVVSIWWSSFNNKSIATLTIPNGITNIWVNAFYFNSIVSLTLPSTLTTIWSFAFYINSLTSLTIPVNVTSIWRQAFDWQLFSAWAWTVYWPGSWYIYDLYINNTSNEFDKSKLPNYVVQ